MAKKFPQYYEKHLYSRNRFRILTKRLKEVLAEELNSLIREFGMTHPPFDPMRISRVGKAKIDVCFISSANLAFEASIESSSEGFVIRVDERLKDPRRRKRLRASVAHELMHTFFYDTSQLPPSRLGTLAQSRKMNQIEEDVCRHLVREFLMPRPSLAKTQAQRADLKIPSIRSLKALKSIYDVSSDIVAYRMVKDLSVWDGIFIKCQSIQGGFWLKQRLKGSYPGYKKLKIPKYVPRSEDEFSQILLGHLLRTLKSPTLEVMNVQGETFRFESARDTVHPLTLVTFITPWKYGEIPVG